MAISNKKATLAHLLPDPEKEKKDPKTGGRRGSRSPREDTRPERINARIKKEQVEYQEQLYKNTLDAFENAPKLEELPDTMDKLEEQLNTWIAGETELAVDQIEALKPSDEQRTLMLETATRKAQALREEQVNNIADTLAKVLQNFIDTSMENISDGFERAMRDTQQNLALAQARVTGLGRSVGNENTPEYYKTVMQRRADEASVLNDRATMQNNDRRIQELMALAEKVREDKEEIESRLNAMLNFVEQEPTSETAEVIVVTGQIDQARASLRGIEEKMEDIDQQTEALIDTNVALKTSYDVLNTVPTTFGDGMKYAFEAIRIEADSAGNLGQDLIKNLDQPLRAVHDSFKGFFSDMLSGTMSLSQAFENMAGRIIDAILEMVAVALANQFFSILGSAFMGGGNVSGLTSEFGSATDSLSSWGLWRGGEVTDKHLVKPKGYYGGGQISGGLGTRDSTLINAARGEYVIRRPAAQSIGKGFLDAINARGANALKDAGPKMNINMGQPASPVNVYVVAPEQQPSMGPDDVLATFTNDVLKGGVTKKLIQQVSR